MSLRQYPRLSLRFPVEYAGKEGASRCFASTLGGGGLFLSEVSGLEPGNEISLRFRPAKHLPVIQAKGDVRYVLEGKGAAVAFTEINVDDRR